MSNNDKDSDHVFRFRIEPPTDPPLYDDPLVELVREQLRALLDVVALLENGTPREVDSFIFLHDPEKMFRIRPPDGE